MLSVHILLFNTDIIYSGVARGMHVGSYHKHRKLCEGGGVNCSDTMHAKCVRKILAPPLIKS